MKGRDIQQWLKTLETPDSSADERTRAIESLAGYPDVDSIRHLVLALEDDDVKAREMAAGALAQFGDAAVVPLLEALRAHPSSIRLRENACVILSQNLSQDVRRRSVALVALLPLANMEPALLAHTAQLLRLFETLT